MLKRLMSVALVVAVLVLLAPAAAVEGSVCRELWAETAWASGTRYTERGSWATYVTMNQTPYVTTRAVLYAGQTIPVGYVYVFDDLPGQVRITIKLDVDGVWEFAPGDVNVSIQGYNTPPSGNPAPGQFEWQYTASWKVFSTTVPEYAYYGIHVNVGQWVVVACPVVP